LLVAAAYLGIQSADATPSDCREAVDAYNSAVTEVVDTIKRYARCIADSNGHDDCSTEFRRLRSAHDDFESAVSSYESDCG
jgi:hypothetical protein